jgi:hypothetical protein
MVRMRFLYSFFNCKQQHVLKMGTSELRTDFGKFLILQSRWTPNHPHDRSHRRDNFESLGSSLRLLLNIRVPPPPQVTLEDVQLNITRLLPITANFSGATKITISVTAGESVSVSEATMNLQMFRDLALSAFSDVAKAGWDKWEIPSLGCRGTSALWMNGCFEVVGVDRNDRIEYQAEDAHL